jgi:hypothetical protein
MDIAHYRRSETAAKQAMTSWRRAQAHTPGTFERVGFPTRVESTADLMALTDTMQEGRFEAYQQELGGLDELDTGLLVDALASFAKFFCQTFHTSSAPLPFDTMMSVYALRTKIYAHPDPRSVLDIGPGCGYLSFLPIPPYTQIESCESFYMLQSLVNDFCVELGHYEGAALTTPAGAVRHSHSTDIVHLPWWAIDGITHPGFDVVMCNAMLTELSSAALMEYVDLIAAVLRPDGTMIVQCIGGGALDWNQIVAYLASKGLHMQSYGTPADGFAVPNFTFGKTEKPAIKMARRGPIGKFYTKDEITALVVKALA